MQQISIKTFYPVTIREHQMNRCIGLTKLVFAHDVFEYSDGTKMRLEMYVKKEGAFMTYVS